VTTERILHPLPTQDSGPIVAPFQFVAGANEALLWRVWCSDLSRTAFGFAELDLRTMDPTGLLQTFVFTQQPAQVGVAATLLIPLNAGAVVNVAVRTVVQSFPTCATYTTVDLVRGSTVANATFEGQILGGYIGPGKSLAWPGPPIEPWYGTSGVYRVFDFTPLGPGIEAIHASSTLGLRLLSAIGTLATSAVAGARFPTYVIVDALTALAFDLRTPLLTAMTAGQTFELGWEVGPVVPFTTAPRFYGGLPSVPILLHPMDTLRTSTTGLLAGDQWFTCQCYGEVLVPPAF
jgi:hypothetical protein